MNAVNTEIDEMLRYERACWQILLETCSQFRKVRHEALQGNSFVYLRRHAQDLAEVTRQCAEQEARANAAWARAWAADPTEPQERRLRDAEWRIHAARQARCLLLSGMADMDYFDGRTDTPPKLMPGASWRTLEGEERPFQDTPLLLSDWLLAGDLAALPR